MNSTALSATRRIHYFDSLSSTQEIARRLAHQGAAHGEVVLAEWQTAGKGRRGAAWHCPKGKGILASVILRPGKATPQVPLLSLAAALAVAQAIGATTGLPARTKWPNDILIGGKKVAGILVETSATDAGPLAIVGIGVNVNFHLQELFSGSNACVAASQAELTDTLSQPATTILDELGSEVDRLTLLARIVARLEGYAQSIASGNLESLLAAWRRADAYIGKAVQVRIGDEFLHGIYEDIGADGSLILHAPNGQRHRLNAGEVRRVESPESILKASSPTTQEP